MTLVKSIVLKKEIAANRVGNRRTGNFNMARPQLDDSGKIIIQTQTEEKIAKTNNLVK